MKIGVISDTHGIVGCTEAALRALDRARVDLTIHCGDVGPDVVPLFRGRKTHFVGGNIDDDARLRQAIVEPEHTFHERLGTMEIENLRVAFLHGDDVKLLHHTIHAGHWDLVCHGHTHVFSTSREGRTLVLNPDALARTREPSLAVVETPSLEVTRIAL